MRIWTEWWSWVAPLRPTCSRLRSFLWLLTALAGISIRSDLLGVTSVIRVLGLGAQCYDRLLDFFHSKAVDPDALCRCWVRIVFARMPGIHRVNGRPVLLGDGLKIPKRGRKMAAVKLLHQVSDCNTKPEQNRSFAQHPPVRERQVSRQTSATLKGHCLRAFGARFKTYPL